MDQESPPPGSGRRKPNSKGEQGADDVGGAEEIGEKKPDRHRELVRAARANQPTRERVNLPSEVLGGLLPVEAMSSRLIGAPANREKTHRVRDPANERARATSRAEIRVKRNTGVGGGDESSNAGEEGSETAAGEKSGDGNTSSGQSAESNQDSETGKSSQENGNQETEEQQSKGSSGQQGHPQNSTGDETEKNLDANDDALGDSSTGGHGRFGTDGKPKRAADGGEPGGDEANLEYARRQTDLVLDKLSDMLAKKQVDEEMLDRLGWTEQDLQRFVNRWKSRQQQAQGAGDDAQDAKREWLDALRSLGMKRQNLGQSKQRDDDFRDLKEGVRVPVPLEFRDRLRAYNQRISKSQD